MVEAELGELKLAGLLGFNFRFDEGDEDDEEAADDDEEIFATCCDEFDSKDSEFERFSDEVDVDPTDVFIINEATLWLMLLLLLLGNEAAAAATANCCAAELKLK